MNGRYRRRLTPRKQPPSARTGAIITLLMAGELTYQEIGAQFGITRQRVHQIAKRYLVNPRPIEHRGRYQQAGRLYASNAERQAAYRARIKAAQS